MPSLTIKPPRPPSERSSSSASQNDSFTFSAPAPGNTTFYPSSTQDAPSPVAPEYSPITPKVQPILPAIDSSQNGGPAIPPPADTNTQQQPAPDQQVTQPAIPPTEYIERPPPKPFSSEDSTDAIALRAAISALQFQKKKAQDDMRTLESTKKHALENPQLFKEALAAGQMKEQRHQFGGVQAILDESDDDENDDDDDDGDDEHENGAVLGAKDQDEMMGGMEGAERQSQANARREEVPDSQPSPPRSATRNKNSGSEGENPPGFSRIPGPQNVVRMPHVNWEKYHVLSEPLDRMHEQQRKWPGSTAYGQDRGREHAVAAPYSPFLDRVEGQNGNGKRTDSLAGFHHAPSPTGTISEHPMETRRSSKNTR